MCLQIISSRSRCVVRCWSRCSYPPQRAWVEVLVRLLILSCDCTPWEAVVVAQVVRPLSLTWETWIEFLPSGFILAHPQLLGPEEWTCGQRLSSLPSLFFSLLLSFSLKQQKKYSSNNFCQIRAFSIYHILVVCLDITWKSTVLHIIKKWNMTG